MRRAQDALEATIAATTELNRAVLELAHAAFLGDDDRFKTTITATIKARLAYLRTARALNAELDARGIARGDLTDAS